MAHKKFIKTNEARILTYLKSAEVRIRYTRAIAAKLNIDYGYCIHALACMNAKGWIQREKMPTKTYYHIRKAAPLKEAANILKEQKKTLKQKELV